MLNFRIFSPICLVRRYTAWHVLHKGGNGTSVAIYSYWLVWNDKFLLSELIYCITRNNHYNFIPPSPPKENKQKRSHFCGKFWALCHSSATITTVDCYCYTRYNIWLYCVSSKCEQCENYKGENVTSTCTAWTHMHGSYGQSSGFAHADLTLIAFKVKRAIA